MGSSSVIFLSSPRTEKKSIRSLWFWNANLPQSYINQALPPCQREEKELPSPLKVEEQLSVPPWQQRSIMVGHQFYTRLNGVPVQVIKHSPSATYISHLYNCWRCHSLPTFLLLWATFSPASGHLEISEDGRRKTERERWFLTLHSWPHSFQSFVSYAIILTPSFTPCIFFPPSRLINVKNVFIGILVVTGKAGECLNKLRYIGLLAVIVTHSHNKQWVGGRVHY